MKKIITVFFIIILLSVTVNSKILSIDLIDKKELNSFYTNDTNIIYVDKNNTIGPWDGTINNPYQNISDGVSNAKEGDTVFVYNETYYENIAIDKKINLTGESRENTIIDGKYKNYGIKITKDNVKIEKFTIKNTGGYEGDSGIIIESNQNKISNCIIKRTRTGLLLNNSNQNIIDNCILYLNGEGIYTKQSENLKIKNSEFCYSSIGLNSRDSENIEIKNCYIHEIGTGGFFNISKNVDFLNCAICDNNDNGGGVAIYNSNNFNFENCNIMHNGFGLKIVNSNSIDLKNSNIENITHFGIWIKEKSDDIKISDCNIINNFRHGIYMIDGKCNIEKTNLYDNSIESVYLEESLCKARNNWWGGKLGPIFNYGFRITDIPRLKFGKIIYFPWSKNPFQNAGSDWKVKENFTKTIVHGYEDEKITLPGNDTDNDGIPDWWEEEFNYNTTSWDDHFNLDPDGDGLNNFEECYAYNWGADPYKKDIFLEIDYTESRTPDQKNILPEEYVNEMKEKFEEHDITLHVDQGQLGGGELIPYITNFNFDKLTDLYWDYFLHNDLNNPRKNIFHYGLICDQGPGNGFAFIGWGHLNSFCISADELSSRHKIFERGKLITHGSMHELGHTMGLFVDDFGGNDNHAAIHPRYKEYYIYRNYKSLMNYRYTYLILDFSDGDNGKNDYNDWEGMEFDFFKNTHFEWPKK